MAQLVPPHAAAPTPRIRVEYAVEARSERFLLEEETMPEAPLHDQVLLMLHLLLQRWVERAGRQAHVARNLACRWDPHDARVGVDPDLCIIEPPPADLDTMKQLRPWEGHAIPFLGVEVVSTTTAAKDYLDAPIRYARLGVRELWIFDPLGEGPVETGGPFRLQMWRRDADRMSRVYAGTGPARSVELDVWLVVTDGGRRLRLADDELGTQLLPTPDEARARAEIARATVDAENADLRRRIAELEAAAKR